MIGFILLTHTHIGREMIKAVEAITKEKAPISCVEMSQDTALQETQEEIKRSIESMKEKSGIIILTDLFGATPANLCKLFCEKGKLEIVTGCNLPMVLKAATTPFTQGASEAASFLKKYGAENIRTSPVNYPL